MAKKNKGKVRPSSAGRGSKPSVPPAELPPTPSDDLASSGAAAPAGTPSSAPPSSRSTADASAVPPGRGPVGAAWGEPVARFERRWTHWEARLITFVLAWLLIALVSWVLLNGLSLPRPNAAASNEEARDAGMIFRRVVGAVLLGMLSWRLTRSQGLTARRWVTGGAIALGLLAAPLWRDLGIVYFDNFKAWLQGGSTLTLLGGLRGLGTRLTLWLALLGASLATAAGKHINIDVIFRFLPALTRGGLRPRLYAAVLNFSAAIVMCGAAAYGFVDHIAIESFGSKADDRMLSERKDPDRADEVRPSKAGNMLHHMGNHFFLTRKQIGLDLRTLPTVLAGGKYDKWMSAADWNAWVRDAGFEDRYPAEQVKNLIVPDDAGEHVPLVVSPDGETTTGILIHSLNLVFPFGMLVIAIRFFLRILLAISGHIDLDPDAAHKEDLHRPEPTDPLLVGGPSVPGGASGPPPPAALRASDPPPEPPTLSPDLAKERA